MLSASLEQRRWSLLLVPTVCKSGNQVRGHIPEKMIDTILLYLLTMYNRQSELNADVSDDGKNSFDVTLKFE